MAERTNFLRLIATLYTHGTRALQFLLHKSVKQAGLSLQDWLKRHKGTMRTHLKKAKNPNRYQPLFPAQFNFLFPQIGEQQPSIQLMDITLTSYLLTHFCAQDLTTDETTCMNKIRSIRNSKKLAHGNGNIDNDEFRRLWCDLSQCISPILPDLDFDELMRAPLDAEEVKKWEQKLKDQVEMESRMAMVERHVEELSNQIEEARASPTVLNFQQNFYVTLSAEGKLKHRCTIQG